MRSRGRVRDRRHDNGHDVARKEIVDDALGRRQRVSGEERDDHQRHDRGGMGHDRKDNDRRSARAGGRGPDDDVAEQIVRHGASSYSSWTPCHPEGSWFLGSWFWVRYSLTMVVPPPPLRAARMISSRMRTAAIAPIAIHTGLAYHFPPPRFTLMSTLMSFPGFWKSCDADMDIVVPADTSDADVGCGARTATPTTSASDSNTPRMSSPPAMGFARRRPAAFARSASASLAVARLISRERRREGLHDTRGGGGQVRPR